MIRKRLWNLVFHLGWENLHYFNKTESHFVSEPQYALLPKANQGESLWDMGSSLGFYAAWAATFPNNYRVIAFDISPRADRFLGKTIAANKLDGKVIIAHKPLTLYNTLYRPPLTAHQANSLTRGREQSIHLAQAIELYGSPAVIKMDIEGAEEEFLANPAFWEFIRSGKIKLFVECHSGQAQVLCSQHGMTRHGGSNHWYLL